MDTVAVLLNGNGEARLDRLSLTEPQAEDVVVEITHSGISTGTEKLFWSGQMPPFPGMGYPLVPGYESVGEVVDAGSASGSGLRNGDKVFVPGAHGFEGAKSLFGGAARRLVTPGRRVTRIDPQHGAEAVLLALAATARHAIAGLHTHPPELIVGHGVLGRLLARLTIAAGAPPPMVWEIDPDRRNGAMGYEVVSPEADTHAAYRTIYDASGDGSLLNALVGRIARGGEIVLSGFYSEPLSFAFPPAFMKEARFRVAAEWTEADMAATCALVDSGALSLGGLITHQSPAQNADAAYTQAFEDPACLKMILDWEGTA